MCLTALQSAVAHNAVAFLSWGRREMEWTNSLPIPVLLVTTHDRPSGNPSSPASQAAWYAAASRFGPCSGEPRRLVLGQVASGTKLERLLATLGEQNGILSLRKCGHGLGEWTRTSGVAAEEATEVLEEKLRLAVDSSSSSIACGGARGSIRREACLSRSGFMHAPRKCSWQMGISVPRSAQRGKPSRIHSGPA